MCEASKLRARLPVETPAPAAGRPGARYLKPRLPFRDLSYRHKIPLSVTFVILAAAVFVSATLAVQSYRDLRRDLVGGAESLGRTLSRALGPLMLRDELWPAYETVIAPIEGTLARSDEQTVIVALAADNTVYVSSQPERFPALRPLAESGPQYAALAQRLAAAPAQRVVLDDVVSARLVVAVPILADDATLLGRTLLLYPESLFLERVRATLVQVLLSTLGVLMVLLPVGWYAGNRIAVPLVRLADAMRQIGRVPAARIAEGLYLGDDEIGQLGGQLQRMARALEDKQTLERQVIAADRLAAIGRLTAGIAHEINNPLGGMLNAIDTQRRHGMADPIMARTLSLLERGLLQIKETVAALLVEARIGSHPLAHDDLEDIRTLVLPEANAKRLTLAWRNDVPDRLALPSTPVRQVLMNLLLNAVQAAGEGGFVDCRISRGCGALTVKVVNNGRALSGEQIDRLFEPFNSDSGNGLGLWVTYQIVQQLGGTIQASVNQGETRFQVTLPEREGI